MNDDERKTGRNDGILAVSFAIIILSVASGIIAGIGLLSLALAFHITDPITFLGLGFGAGIIVTWILLLTKGIQFAEVVFHKDINQDGYIGDPENAQPAAQPEKEITVWIPHDDNPGHGSEKIYTPMSTTLYEMALKLHAKGFKYFTQENFTTDEKGSYLMTRDYWDHRFIPSLVAARLAILRPDALGRNRAILTPEGERMFRLIAEKGNPRDPSVPPRKEDDYSLPYPTDE